MIAKLEFTLPEEKIEFDQASRGNEAFYLLSGLVEQLRSVVKYGESAEFPGVTPDCADKIRTWLWNEFQERGIAHLFE